MSKMTAADDELDKMLREHIGAMGPFLDVEYPVDVLLGSTKVTVDQLLKLGPGDTVPLDRASSGYVEIAVGNVSIGEAEVLVRRRGSAARLISID